MIATYLLLAFALGVLVGASVACLMTRRRFAPRPFRYRESIAADLRLLEGRVNSWRCVVCGYVGQPRALRAAPSDPARKRNICPDCGCSMLPPKESA